MKHGHIIPLVGGSVIGTSQAFKSNPTYIASWDVFAKNDAYCLDYYKDVPFYNLDKVKPPKDKIDILTCTPPCSGLSNSTTGTRGCQAPQNQHMINVAEFGMTQNVPVILIENAPMLYSLGGYEFFARFVPIAKKYNYSIQLYKTSTILHGLPQNRQRTFVILWRGKSQPILDWIHKPYLPLNEWPTEDIGDRVFPGKASDDELVRLLYKTLGGRDKLYEYMYGPRTAFTMAQELGLGNHVFKTKRYTKLFDRFKHKAVLDVTPTFVKLYTNALMWKSTTYMINPNEDRFMSIRELMSMMGLPKDFKLIGKAGMNVIFQNVPVNTVQTLTTEIGKALTKPKDYEWRNVPFMRINNIKQRVDSIGYTYKSLEL